MATFILLLRGINVGGRVLKMAQLKTWLGQLGCEDVRTYLQSGNATFERPGGAREAQASIAKRLAHEMGDAVGVWVTTAARWDRLVADNPFFGKRGIDANKLHVTLLSEAPDSDAVRKCEPVLRPGERFEVIEDRVYLHCPIDYGNTKMSNAWFERTLKCRATTRNWRTCLALQKQAAGGS